MALRHMFRTVSPRTFIDNRLPPCLPRARVCTARPCLRVSLLARPPDPPSPRKTLALLRPGAGSASESPQITAFLCLSRSFLMLRPWSGKTH